MPIENLTCEHKQMEQQLSLDELFDEELKEKIFLKQWEDLKWEH